MTIVIQHIGRFAMEHLGNAGRGSMLLWNIIAQLPYAWKQRDQINEQMHIVAIGSLPLVITTSIFVGAVTAVQGVYQM